MIKFCNDEIGNFVLWFNKHYAINQDALVSILHAHDTVCDDENDYGFAVYIPSKRLIMVAGELPGGNKSIIECLLHEYAHHIQNMNGRPFDEEKAEKFAKEISDCYYAEMEYDSK
jgi:hypothetical protein